MRKTLLKRRNTGLVPVERTAKQRRQDASLLCRCAPRAGNAQPVRQPLHYSLDTEDWHSSSRSVTFAVVPTHVQAAHLRAGFSPFPPPPFTRVLDSVCRLTWVPFRRFTAPPRALPRLPTHAHYYCLPTPQHACCLPAPAHTTPCRNGVPAAFLPDTPPLPPCAPVPQHSTLRRTTACPHPAPRTRYSPDLALYATHTTTATAFYCAVPFTCLQHRAFADTHTAPPLHFLRLVVPHACARVPHAWLRPADRTLPLAVRLFHPGLDNAVGPHYWFGRIRG